MFPDEDPNFGGVDTPNYGGVPTSQAPADLQMANETRGGCSSEHPAHRALGEAIREVAKMKTTPLTAQALVHLTSAREMIQDAICRGDIG